MRFNQEQPAQHLLSLGILHCSFLICGNLSKCNLYKLSFQRGAEEMLEMQHPHDLYDYEYGLKDKDTLELLKIINPEIYEYKGI